MILAELYVHGPGGRIFEAGMLFYVGIDPADVLPAQQAVQLLRRIGKEAVVEVHDDMAGAVVVIQHANRLLRKTEVPLQTAVQEFPVRPPPAVNGLLHVTHDEIVETAGLTVPEQGPEVLPLHGRGVLELVQEEVFEPHAQLLINERGVGAVDDILEDGIGVVNGNDVLLPLDLLEGLPELSGDAQPIDLATDQERRPVFLVAVAEKGTERFQRPFQAAFQLQAVLVLGLREPLRGIRRILHESSGGRCHGVARSQFLIPVELLHETAVALRRVDAFPPEHVQDSIGSRFHDFEIVLGQSVAPLAHRSQMLFGIDFSFVDAETAYGFVMVPRLEVHGHLLKGRLQIESFTLLKACLHVVREPVQKVSVILRKGVEDPVHALLHERSLVQFHLVGGKLADLTGEGPEGLLEKLVNGGDGEGGIVVQDAAQLPCGTLLKRRRIGKQGRDEIREVGRIPRPGRENVEFLENTPLHLVGGLVREGHGQDVPIGLGVLLHQQQADICTGQVVGLSRPGRSFQDLDHRPQIILKSQ